MGALFAADVRAEHNGLVQRKTARHNSVDKFTGGFYGRLLCISMRKVVLFHEGLVAFERQSEKNGRLQNDNPGIFLFVIALFNSML